ncbi:hypothetical protein COP2_022736 [Malus domestica]
MVYFLKRPSMWNPSFSKTLWEALFSIKIKACILTKSVNYLNPSVMAIFTDLVAMPCPQYSAASARLTYARHLSSPPCGLTNTIPIERSLMQMDLQ